MGQRSRNEARPNKSTCLLMSRFRATLVGAGNRRDTPRVSNGIQDHGASMPKLSPTLAIACLFLTRAVRAENAVPLGQLSRTVVPKAYRLSLNVDPSRPDFSGTTQIDATADRPTRTIFLHGADLRVSSARVRSGTGEMT